MNVLHIIGTPGLGGVQTYLLDLSNYDKKYGISRSLLCLYGNDGELKEKFLLNNVNCIPCSIMPQDYGLQPYRFWKRIRKYFIYLFIIKLFKKVKEMQPDIIVCEEPSNLNQQLIVSRLLKIPYIWHIHNENQFVNVNKFVFNLTFGYYLKNNLYIISDSKHILNKNLEDYKHKFNDGWNKIPILSATSDLNKIFRNKNRGSVNRKSQIHLGSIGRLADVKDYAMLIRVFARVKNKLKQNIYLSIAGSGPMYLSLIELIKKLDLERYVKLLGNIERKNIAKFLYSLDIYVQSSSSEGSPLTIKEAMAASLPIISTKVGGVPEMIIDGETGILVPHDDQEKFVYALIELINMDVENREKMGKKAYSYAMKNYSMESLAKKNAAIYENQCRKSKKHY